MATTSLLVMAICFSAVSNCVLKVEIRSSHYATGALFGRAFVFNFPVRTPIFDSQLDTMVLSCKSSPKMLIYEK